MLDNCVDLAFDDSFDRPSHRFFLDELEVGEGKTISEKTRKSQLGRHLSCDLSTKDSAGETGTCHFLQSADASKPSPPKDPTHPNAAADTAHHLVPTSEQR